MTQTSRNLKIVVGLAALLLGLSVADRARADVSFSTEYFPAGDGPSDVAIADLDGDGDLDLALPLWTSATYDRVAILFNDGTGRFSPAAVFPGVGSAPIAVAAADVDSDGDVDLVVANFSTDDISVLRNLGNGNFLPEVVLPAGDEPADVAVGDLDNDGDLDLAVATRAGVRVFLGDGSGVLYPEVTDYMPGPVGTLLAPVALTILDFDLDGDLDIAAANTRANSVGVLTNLGGGAFAHGDFAELFPVGDTPTGIAAGDLDHDGDLDLVTANSDDSTISVLLNNHPTPPSFVTGGTIPVTGDPRMLAIAEFDGDGKLDLAVSVWGSLSNTVSVLSGDGSGAFSSAGIYDVGSGPAGLAAEDLDSDGDVDVAVAVVNDNNLALLRNLRTGSGPPPEAELTVPTDFDCLCGMVEILGVADVPDGSFGEYVVDYRAASGGSWTLIDSSTAAVPAPGGLLTTWDTTGLAEGYFFLRLTVENSGGSTDDETRIVWVSQDFNRVEFIVAGGDPGEVRPAAVAGGRVCPYGTVNDDRCLPNTFSVDYAPLGGGAFQPVNPGTPTYSGDRLNTTLAPWDSTAVADGEYTLRVTAENACGHTKTMTQSVEIDNTAPLAKIDSPGSCAVYDLDGTIVIRGKIFDANLDRWTLDYTTGGGTGDWVTIADGTRIVDGVIALWDTTGLPTCAYILRLTVWDRAVVNCDDTPQRWRRHFVAIALGPLFYDGFECGDTSRWAATVGGGE